MSRRVVPKAYIQNLRTGVIRPLQFNPQSFSQTRTVKYHEIESPGASYPRVEYVAGGSKTLDLTIFMYDEGRDRYWDVRGFINFMNELIPREKSGIVWRRPPTMLFAYGWYIKKCVIEDMSEEYEDFNCGDTWSGIIRPKKVIMNLKLKVVN